MSVLASDLRTVDSQCSHGFVFIIFFFFFFFLSFGGGGEYILLYSLVHFVRTMPIYLKRLLQEPRI